MKLRGLYQELLDLRIAVAQLELEAVEWRLAKVHR